MYQFHRSLKNIIIDNILVDWQSSKKVISFPTPVISFVKSYQFSDTCHSNNSSHITIQCGQKIFIYFLLAYHYLFLIHILITYRTCYIIKYNHLSMVHPRSHVSKWGLLYLSVLWNLLYLLPTTCNQLPLLVTTCYQL